MEFLGDYKLLDNPLLDWIISLAYILGSVVIARILYKLFSNKVKKWTAETESEIDDVLVDAVEEPICISIVLLGFWLGYSHLELESFDQFVFKVFDIAVVLTVTC